MKNDRRSSSSNPDARSTTESQAAHPWLETSVYEPLRQRTVQLVKQSVDALRLASQRISLSTVATKSKEVDPEQRGISESAILDNQEASAYYEQYRTWRVSRQKQAEPLSVTLSAQSP